MIDQITFKSLKRMSAEELRRQIDVNGGMIFVEVHGSPKFIVKNFPDQFLRHTRKPKD